MCGIYSARDVVVWSCALCSTDACSRGEIYDSRGMIAGMAVEHAQLASPLQHRRALSALRRYFEKAAYEVLAAAKSGAPTRRPLGCFSFLKKPKALADLSVPMKHPIYPSHKLSIVTMEPLPRSHVAWSHRAEPNRKRD